MTYFTINMPYAVYKIAIHKIQSYHLIKYYIAYNLYGYVIQYPLQEEQVYENISIKKRFDKNYIFFKIILVLIDIICK